MGNLSNMDKSSPVKSPLRMLINIAFVYFIVAMVSGVFFREFTKLMGFDERTTLGVMHGHMFALGVMVHLILVVFDAIFKISSDEGYKKFLITYNVFLIVALVMMLVRGITQVNGAVLAKGIDASISGIAGIGHIGIAVGIFILFMVLKRTVHENNISISIK